MTKRFEITIMATATEKVRIRKEWARMIDDPKEGESKFGYTPGDWDVGDVSREIYKQVVDNLDLPAVIGAVNNVPEPKLNGESHISLDDVEFPLCIGSDEYYRLRKVVECGGYLAETAEKFMEVLNDNNHADAVGDMWGTMRMAIFDFRKRVDTLT